MQITSFIYVPQNMDPAGMSKLYEVPSTLRLGNSLGEMEEVDVPAVASLYTQYMQRFDMALTMSVDEVRHHLLSGKGAGKQEENSQREGQVTWTYVVEVTDFDTSTCNGS